jgi:hypothetical protein
MKSGKLASEFVFCLDLGIPSWFQSSAGNKTQFSRASPPGNAAFRHFSVFLCALCG